ncbi:MULTISPECIES: helix-turn-helix transcriptional regulator [Pseudomonas]|jgi:prophage regulatory protein|uniref:helix-turn-helix transcriptional regulator n=1 Tax=Pseudomonas TaxID=286 RepID=UPI0029C0D279|nr:AlpA family phage regulatory protein [Pseudomonas putida]
MSSRQSTNNPSPSTAVHARGGGGSVRNLRQGIGQVPGFDPAATLIRFPDVVAMTGLARATIYKRLKDDPTFPRPVPLSGSTSRGAPVGFVLAEVQRWARERIEARGITA